MSDKYTTTETRVSYGIGRQMGGQLASNPFEGLHIDSVIAGLADALNGVECPVPDELMEAAFKEVSKKMQAKKADEAKMLAAEGENFLAENARRDEVTVTASGLQYEIINEGKGDKPSASSTVRTHYHGTLINGEVFDSSYDRGQPAEFPVNGVISGWTEALQMMGTGAKWRLYVPHHLAYGEHGAGNTIAPFSTLVFDVELLDIID
ncbi:MAG: peptidylprolyl isomerase [Proteobacteria bacterium]|nr:MAG: peptidylprolyl isomerase [Pseudomonadota bacterium]PIE40062.1 MAG: peptidylprolyl isomerase [Gammaproteobacteria bacterium]